MMSGKIDLIQSDGNVQNAKYSIIEDPDNYHTINHLHCNQLIPDEYMHVDNKTGLVIIFHSSSSEDTECARLIQRELQEQKYIVPEENVMQLTTKQTVLDYIEKIALQNHDDKTCLILIMLGNSDFQDRILPDEEPKTANGTITITDLFAPFTGDRCSSFTNKPKIFIFQTSKPIMTVLADTVTFASKPPEIAYQVPEEADILLVHKHIGEREPRHWFVQELCNSFNNFGQTEDIIGLVTATTHNNDYQPPLLISTLTRRFYISSSDQRGLHFEFYKCQEEAINDLESLSGKLSSLKISLKGHKTRNVNSCNRKPLVDSVVDSSNATSSSSVASSSLSLNTVKRKKKEAEKTKRPPWR